MWPLQEGATTPGFGGMKGTNRNLSKPRDLEVRSVELRVAAGSFVRTQAGSESEEKKLSNKSAAGIKLAGGSSNSKPKDFNSVRKPSVPSETPEKAVHKERLQLLSQI